MNPISESSLTMTAQETPRATVAFAPRLAVAPDDVAPLRLAKMHQHEVEQAIERLANCVQQDGLRPACVIGILEGGREPARLFAECFSDAPPTVFIKLQRRSTGRLKRWFVNVVTLAPTGIINYIRLLEMRLRDAAHERQPFVQEFEPVPDLVDSLKTSLAGIAATRERPVFIVDDAIDTGTTVARAAATLQAAGVAADAIKVACLTQTLKTPCIRPDYTAHERVVYRFPWSMDAAVS